jgi:hypothetical protein
MAYTRNWKLDEKNKNKTHKAELKAVLQNTIVS